jgi:hypothetical protein
VSAVFLLGRETGFSKWKRREIYDILLERIERILGAMNQFGKAAPALAWGTVVQSWLQSRGFIKVHIPKKCHPILAHFFTHE